MDTSPARNRRCRSISATGTARGVCAKPASPALACAIASASIRNSCRRDVQLRRLPQPAESVAAPRRQAFQQEQTFEQRHVVMDRLPRELKRPGQIADVEQAHRMARRLRQQARQRVERAQAGRIAHVALDLRFDEIAVPRAAPRRRAAGQCRRITAGRNAFGEFRSKSPGQARATPPANRASRQRARLRSSPHCASGSKRKMPSRPASESASAGTASRRARLIACSPVGQSLVRGSTDH